MEKFQAQIGNPKIRTGEWNHGLIACKICYNRLKFYFIKKLVIPILMGAAAIVRYNK